MAGCIACAGADDDDRFDHCRCCGREAAWYTKARAYPYPLHGYEVIKQAGGWFVFATSPSDGAARPVSGPFWRWKTAARVAGDLLRETRDAVDYERLGSSDDVTRGATAPEGPPDARNSPGIDHDLISPPPTLGGS